MIKILITNTMTKTINIKKYFRIGLLSLLFVFIVSYTIFQTKSINRGVVLNIEGIKDGQTFSNSIVPIQGNAVHASHLYVNGREIAVDIKGDFKYELVMSSGYNIITVEAEDRFSKSTRKIYNVFFKEPTEDVALSVQN